MPIVRIDIQSGKSTEYKRDILHGIRSALTSALGVADDRIMQRIIETDADDIDVTESRSDRLTVIDISMLPGRGAQLKQALFDEIVSNLAEKPGVHARDIQVVLNEPAAECFSLGGVWQCTLVPAPEEAE